jgi:hypothetical protein
MLGACLDLGPLTSDLGPMMNDDNLFFKDSLFVMWRETI